MSQHDNNRDIIAREYRIQVL